jgi:hypothetical protein
MLVKQPNPHLEANAGPELPARHASVHASDPAGR